MRKSLGHLTLGGATVAGTVLISAPAYATGQDYYVSTAVDNLAASNVYIDNTVTIADPEALDALDSNVAYVALPAQAGDAGLSATGVANQILQAAANEGKTFDAVLVTIGGSDSLPVSAAGPAGTEVATIINSAGTSGGPVSTAIGASSAEITEAVSATTTTTTSTAASSGEVPAYVPVAAVGGGAVGVLLVAATIAFVVRKRSGHQIGAAKRVAFSDKPAKLSFEHLPVELKKASEELREAVATLHRERQQELAREVEAILRDVDQLFVRIARKGTEHQARLAAVEYSDSFGKLSTALGNKYYLDIVQHPDYWDTPEERLAEVWEAVKATKADVIRNIKLINSSQDLEFKVALESLSRSLNSLDAGSMLGDKPTSA